MSRHRPATQDEAVPCIVAFGRLIFDQVAGKQVGAGATVLVHPALVDGWLRNGWVIVRSEDEAARVVAEHASDERTGMEQVPPTPTAPARKARRNPAAAK